MAKLEDSLSLGMFNVQLRSLHAKAKAGTLDDAERTLYERMRDDLARMLLFAQQLTRRPGEKFRHALRVAATIAVAIESPDRRIDGETLDLSSGGFGARLPSALPVGNTAQALLTLGSDNVLGVRARVVASTPTGTWFRTSFAFEGLGPMEQERVDIAVFDCVLSQLGAALSS
jgi:hypothetical protein